MLWLFGIQRKRFPFKRSFKVNVYVHQNVVAIISTVFVSNIQNDCIHDSVFLFAFDTGFLELSTFKKAAAKPSEEVN